MKRVQLSEIETAVEDIRRGETIELVDGETAIAEVTPKKAETEEELLDKLEREGFIRRGSREPWPEWFFEEEPPDIGRSAVEQLLNDRRKYDW